MCSILVVVADVLFHKTFQVPFVEHDHMVEQIPAAVADKAFCNSVLPRTTETGSLRLDAEDLQRVDDFLIEVCTAIEDQVAGSRVVRECLAQLLNDPGAGRMPRHIEVQNTPPVMSNDEEAIENAKGDRRYGEEIHRGNCFTMIAQKCHPSLSWLGTPRHSPHPTQHGTFRSVEAQHLQLTVNARRAPSGILRDHAKDQLAQFSAHTLSSHGGRCRESHLQYNLKPARCQRTTVSGWMRISARFHPGQRRRKIPQKNLSEIPNRG